MAYRMPHVSFGYTYYDGHNDEAYVFVDEVLVGYTSEGPTYDGRRITGTLAVFRPSLRDAKETQWAQRFGLESLTAPDSVTLRALIRRKLRRG